MNETSTPDAYSTDGVYGESAPEINDAPTAEELFELIEGKNSDGSPIKKGYTKEELLKIAQKGLGADKAFEQSKAEREQMRQLARAMQDPSQLPVVLKHLGIDLDQFLQERMAHQMLENMKSPEEKEMEQYRKEAEEFRRLKAEQAKQEEESKIHARAEEIRHSLYSRINDTLNSAGVPKTTATIAEVSRFIKMKADAAERQGKEFDINTVNLEQIVAHLKTRQKENFDSLFGDDLDDDGLLSLIPEALQKRIAAAMTKKLQGGKVTDINSIKRDARATNWDAPMKKAKNINSTEANERIADKIAAAQAQWDKMNRR